MILMLSPNRVYIAESVGYKWQLLWAVGKAFTPNLTQILPDIDRELDSSEIVFTGVKSV